MIIHNPILTGSFTVNGTDVSSITSSAASLTSLNAYTASQNIRNGTYATTGSNTFAGIQTVNSNLVVTGSITAATLVVQTITSSVDFVTGSTRFGSLLANTHTFTGSMNLTGSLTVTTTGTELQVNANGVNLGNALTDSHVISGSLTVNPGGLFVSSSGNVGIGITDLGPTGLSLPATSNYAWSEGSGNAYAVLFRQRNSAATVIASGYKRSNTAAFASSFGTSMSRAAIAVGYSNGSIAFFSDSATNVANGTDITPTERMTITNGGDVFINNPSGVSLNSLTNKLSISSTTYNLLDISRFSDNAFGPNFYLVKSRNGTIGGNTIVANGDNLGNITWVGATGGTGLTDAANIRAEVDGTPGTGDMPGRLVFSTTADGASSTTERIRIFSSGDVRINFNPGGGNGLYFNDSTNSAVMLYIIPAVYVGSSPFNRNRFIASNSSQISFETGATERVRIGNIGFTANLIDASDANSKIFLDQVNTGAGLIPTLSGATFYLYGRSSSTNYRVTLSGSPYFTGQHGNKPINLDLKTNIQNYIGLIVSSTGTYYSVNPITQEVTTGKDAIQISEALPEIKLTDTDQDKAVWGVVTNVKNDNYNTNGTVETDNNTEWGDRLGENVIRINGLGEGAIWVTNINGNIENGDYICSSTIPGYGRKQNDDLLHNYTVAKSTMDCNFDLNNDNLYVCEEFEFEGQTYKKAFIGCTYHCS